MSIYYSVYFEDEYNLGWISTVTYIEIEGQSRALEDFKTAREAFPSSVEDKALNRNNSQFIHEMKEKIRYPIIRDSIFSLLRNKTISIKKYGRKSIRFKILSKRRVKV